MFYSHTFLARKGPLSTVWIAAHLQHRLKKSHYTSTDISSTVVLWWECGFHEMELFADRIMFPEAPIALRMSGHLLLGVVRIYSKKVDYLHHDCNVLLVGLRKAFASTEVNLPEGSSKAPLESVTLPETFELDALDLDFDSYHQGSPDNHIRSQEDITLIDQIPVERDLYVAISFDDVENSISGIRLVEGDIFSQPPVDSNVAFRNPGPSNRTDSFNEVPDSGVRPMEEDAPPPVPVDSSVGFQDPGPSNQTNERINEDNSPQIFPEMEVRRDAVHDFRSEELPVWPDLGKDNTESHRPVDQITNEKEIHSPVVEDVLVSGGQSLPFQQRSEQPASAALEEAPDIFDTHISFGHKSPELAIRSTPPVEQPKPKSRKRKQLYDESTVLTNKFMKKALEDSHDLLRKRRNIPCSLLGVWKSKNRLRKEQIFLESSITGLCADLHDISEKDFISRKPHLVTLEEAPEPRVAHPEPRVAQPQDMEIERLRQYEADARSHILPEVETSPFRRDDISADNLGSGLEPQGETTIGTGEAPEPRVAQPQDMEIERLRRYEADASSHVLPEVETSPFRRDDYTPISADNLGSRLEPQGETTIGTGELPTPDLEQSTEHLGSEMDTPMTFLEERLGFENTGLSDIPELINSAGTEELNFLEADNNTPAGSQGNQNGDILSVRTSAVAQYLKRTSSVTRFSEDPTGDLSLTKILEGKSRKLCARMFFETLVLKSYGLVDVHQEEPYGVITLKLTSRLKAQF